MKKAAIASLLAVPALLVPGAIVRHGALYAQAASQGVQMDPAEAAVYNPAVAMTSPQAQAPALEAYLTKYPKSAVKAYVLQLLLHDYVQFDHAKAIDTADKVLQLDPNNLQALTIEVVFRTEAAQAQTDAAAKQSGLDSAASYAQKGLNASKPTDMSDADYTKAKAQVTPTFYSTIGAAALGRKDSAAAVSAYKSELAAVPQAATETVGTPLQDTYYLGVAYYGMDPKDLVNCTFYTTRAAQFAPDTYKAQFQPLATYCYKAYHGNTDGYDAVVAAAKANLTPPADFKIVPRPTDADYVKQIMTPGADQASKPMSEYLAGLALSDKEFVLQKGTKEQADQVFDPIKGKTVTIPDATVVSATDSQVQVSVSDESVQAKTADFTFNLKTPLKATPAAGAKISLTGTYASYTQDPLMITMSDAEEVVKKSAPVKKAPVRRR